ncbi:bifunctional peptidase and arginyl-hydroxylase JMJD5 [Daktulosphaira vitifoliae]|uniref:bifunctional peptidase and arginyl-hydroxylase JMJD5 n=1 Tax=Daktulosphaira vitifoliae TaxID=58002 RepID=UPI0021A98632|nr:bifunctional peptidase and arginyl-hydroxylase JMJD5 [Daktulosphaira vitifoliae]
MRKLYSHASLFKTKLLLNCSQNEDSIKKAIKAVDMGLLMGNSFRDELTEAATFLCKILQPNTNFIKDQIEIPKHLNDECILGHFDKIMSISTSEQPSLETFYRDYLKLKIPVKITGAMSHWPAMKKWKDLNYIIKTAGCRTVPVEIGSSYADEDWSQTLITIEEFIKDKVINPNEKTTYLAQHQLFNQIPELKEDIKVPDYCYLSEADDNEPDINAWFGPKGTISPTHYDPKNNFLAQVVGFKDIFLFDPKWTDCLYPYEEKLLKNTAQVDPSKPDLNTYPKFTEVEAIHCILSEALCILEKFLNSLFYIFNDLMSGDCCWLLSLLDLLHSQCICCAWITVLEIFGGHRY